MGDGLHVNESDGSVFNTDGAVPIDHNVREREMKRAVLNRKKLLVREQPPGGRTAGDPGQLDQTFETRADQQKSPPAFVQASGRQQAPFLEARLHADDFDIAPFAAAVSDRRPEKARSPDQRGSQREGNFRCRRV